MKWFTKLTTKRISRMLKSLTSLMRFPRKKAVRAPRATQLEEPLMGCLTVVWLGPPSR